MNGASGFHEVWSSPPDHLRIVLPHEQRHRFGTGSWHLLHTQDLIVRPQASAQREKRLLSGLKALGAMRVKASSSGGIK